MSSPLTNDSGSDIFSYDNLQKYDTLLYKLGKTLTTKGKTLHPSLAEMKQIVLFGLVWFSWVLVAESVKNEFCIPKKLYLNTLHTSLAEMKPIVWFGLVGFRWLRVPKMYSAYPKISIFWLDQKAI